MIDLIYPDWPAPPNIRAFSTTRKGGVSQGPWQSLNFGDNCGDDPLAVDENRRLLQSLLPSKPNWLKQVHGKRVVSLDQDCDSVLDADASICTTAERVCTILTADCLPVLICNKAGTKIAAAHAGWRGLAAGVLEATVAAMDCDPAELMAWLGPAIGPDAFEVGRDVYEAFCGNNLVAVSAFKPHKDRWLADLYSLAKQKLEGAGVNDVSGGQYCTYTDKARFFSYRRDGETGRMATVICMID